MTPPRTTPKVYLLASDDERPFVRLEPGKHYDVSITTVVDSDLKSVADEAEGDALRPARLCGSRSTCVAIVETE
jgi:hypothetical protein